MLWWITSLPHWTWLPHWPGINISHHRFTEPKTFWQNEECCVRLSRTKWKVFSMALFYLSMYQWPSEKVSASLDTFSHYTMTWFTVPLLTVGKVWKKYKLKVASCTGVKLKILYISQMSSNLSWKPFSPLLHKLPSLALKIELQIHPEWHLKAQWPCQANYDRKWMKVLLATAVVKLNNKLLLK